MDWVDELAECLVELRTQASLTFTSQQVATIVGLWQNLDQFDKDRVMYAAHHQDRLLTKSLCPDGNLFFVITEEFGS